MRAAKFRKITHFHTLSTSKYGSSSVDMNTASSVRACEYASAAAKRLLENAFHIAHVMGGVGIEACVFGSYQTKIFELVCRRRSVCVGSNLH
jgi:hypothetical protein